MSAHVLDVGTDNFEQVVIEGSRRAPVLIDFWAPWCGPCRALGPVLERLAEAYAGRFVLARINSDENQALAREFGVRGIPAVKAVVDGKVVDEFTGALPESQVRAFIERILPTPADVLCKEAAALAGNGRHADALAKVEQALALSPRHVRARIDRLELLVALERLDEARALMTDLDVLIADDPRVIALRSRLAFSGGGASDAVALAAAVAADPADLGARLALAKARVQAGEHEGALGELLEIVRRDRKFGDDVGRRTMIDLFNLPGIDPELVARYRRMLASALH